MGGGGRGVEELGSRVGLGFKRLMFSEEGGLGYMTFDVDRSLWNKRFSHQRWHKVTFDAFASEDIRLR